MFKLALCDDNSSFLTYEKSIIEKFLTEKEVDYICDSFTSGEDLLCNKQSLFEYDLFILDYELTGINGFSLANEIYNYAPEAHIAFSTTFYNFTKEGYKYNAIRYLLKNDNNYEQDLYECIEYALKLFANNPTINNKIELKTIFGNQITRVTDIIYIKSKGHYCSYYIYDSINDSFSELICRDKLSNIETKLGTDFVRTHQSILVNLKYLLLIDYKSTKIRLTSTETASLPLIRNRYDTVRKKICLYNGVNL